METRTRLIGAAWVGLISAVGCNGLLGVDGPPRGVRGDAGGLGPQGAQSGGGSDLHPGGGSAEVGGTTHGAHGGDAAGAGNLGGDAGLSGAGAAQGGVSGSGGGHVQAGGAGGDSGGAGGVESGGTGGLATGGIDGGFAGTVGGQSGGTGGEIVGVAGGLISGHSGGFAGETGGDTATGGAGADGGAVNGGDGGGPLRSPSCVGMVGDECNGESCCETIEVPAGTLQMGQGETSSTDYFSSDGTYDNERPEHLVTVDAFALDRYEVTVGRFRSFVNCKANGTCSDWTPAVGAGANQAVEAAHASYHTGWDADWELPPSVDAWDYVLRCNSGLETWTVEGSEQESLPINCVSWFEAMAFCIWDGGRLPTEAEWEYVAAGGDENRRYPWGGTAPSCALANLGGCGGTPQPVGSYASTGRWGHYDLAGNLWEWTFDTYRSNWYSDPEATGENVCSTGSSDNRVIRGGDYVNASSWHRSASRGWGIPTFHSHFWGFRCARPVLSPSAD